MPYIRKGGAVHGILTVRPVSSLLYLKSHEYGDLYVRVIVIEAGACMAYHILDQQSGVLILKSYLIQIVPGYHHMDSSPLPFEQMFFFLL